MPQGRRDGNPRAVGDHPADEKVQPQNHLPSDPEPTPRAGAKPRPERLRTHAPGGPETTS